MHRRDGWSLTLSNQDTTRDLNVAALDDPGKHEPPNRHPFRLFGPDFLTRSISSRRGGFHQCPPRAPATSSRGSKATKRHLGRPGGRARDQDCQLRKNTDKKLLFPRPNVLSAARVNNLLSVLQTKLTRTAAGPSAPAPAPALTPPPKKRK